MFFLKYLSISINYLIRVLNSERVIYGDLRQQIYEFKTSKIKIEQVCKYYLLEIMNI